MYNLRYIGSYVKYKARIVEGIIVFMLRVIPQKTVESQSNQKGY